MNRRTIGCGKTRAVAVRIILAAAIEIILALPLRAASMGISDGHDLDALWSRAQRDFALAEQDAVLLLEGRYVTLSAEGDRVTRVHRVVWIGAEIGIDLYADLRIPYNSASSTLEVVALRTWRDDAWWPDEKDVSETAVVETLPFAVAAADDYRSMRETMLLHDGVGLPCIMETMYDIRERGAASDGSDDLFVFPQDDPAVLVEYALTAPAGSIPRYRCGNGAPEPAVTRSEDGATTYRWRMESLDRRGSPLIAKPAVYEPYVAWSTWSDWSALGRRIASSFDAAAVPDTALADTLAGRLEHEPTLAAKARRITALVDEYARVIQYDSKFWEFSPRPAARTYETAYGHPLDRAVLAAALFRAAGLEAELILCTAPSVPVDQDIPGLSRFEEPAVYVSDEVMRALYDPSEGTLRDGMRVLDGRIVWKPKTESAPPALPVLAGFEAESRLELRLTLEPDSEKGWSGTGFLYADGSLSPYDEMVGLDGEAMNYIKKLLGSVMSEADAGGYNVEIFAPTMVNAGFDVTVKAGEPDDLGRTRLSIGEPAGGIIDGLPPDVRLFHEERTSPVVRFGTQWQRLTLRLGTGDRGIAHLPEPRTLENNVGRFTLTVERDGDRVTIERMLMLRHGPVVPEAWPQLRALLLEETDEANRTILLK